MGRDVRGCAESKPRTAGVLASRRAGQLVSPDVRGHHCPSLPLQVVPLYAQCCGKFAWFVSPSACPIPPSPQVVPYTLESLVVGAACVASSWHLEPSDVNLNMMPLFHGRGP